MKEELLKSVAQPMQVFFAPFTLTILNIMINAFAIVTLLLFGKGGYIWIPIVGVLIVHIILVAVGRWEPHIDSILAARGTVSRKTKNLIKESGNKYGV